MRGLIVEAQLRLRSSNGVGENATAGDENYMSAAACHNIEQVVEMRGRKMASTELDDGEIAAVHYSEGPAEPFAAAAGYR